MNKPFQIITISKNQAESMKEMAEQLQSQFPGIKRLFVLDRCIDTSSKILSDMGECFIENKSGEGFLAGYVRDTGLSFLGIESTLFFDGDRIPVNFSIELIEEALTLYDICIASREEDCRTYFDSHFVPNPMFSSDHNGVYSCGLCIRKEMIEKIKAIQNGRLFHAVFDGSYGEEDVYLGDVIAYLNGTCGLFPKRSYLKGSWEKKDHLITYKEQALKRIEMVTRLKKRRKIKLYAGLVCPRRSLDYQKLKIYFLLNDCIIVDNLQAATDVIIITCGFVERNIQESLNLIDSVLEKTSVRVLVGGCLSDIDSKRLSPYLNLKIFKTSQIEKIEEFFPEFNIKFKNVPDANVLHDYHEIDSLIGKRENYTEQCFNRPNLEARVFVIRIAEGCNNHCAYCSHKSAIGPYVSKPFDQCVNEFKNGIKQGFRVFRLTAMELGFYGIELPLLLKKFLSIENDIQFFLEDINPFWLVKYIDELITFCRDGKLKAIQTPIQSGSETILKSMGRFYHVNDLIKSLSMLKASYSPLFLSTEVIVGFPGETDQDFDQTLNILVKSCFNYSYIYTYFENSNIKSFNIQPKCPLETIKSRLKRIAQFLSKEKIGYCIFDDLKN